MSARANMWCLGGRESTVLMVIAGCSRHGAGGSDFRRDLDHHVRSAQMVVTVANSLIQFLDKVAQLQYLEDTLVIPRWITGCLKP